MKIFQKPSLRWGNPITEQHLPLWRAQQARLNLEFNLIYSNNTYHHPLHIFKAQLCWLGVMFNAMQRAMATLQTAARLKYREKCNFSLDASLENTKRFLMTFLRMISFWTAICSSSLKLSFFKFCRRWEVMEMLSTQPASSLTALQIVVCNTLTTSPISFCLMDKI